MKMPKQILIFSCFFIASCSYSEKEGAAADDFCTCASNKSFLQKTDCLKFAADLNGIDINSGGYKQAIKEKCPKAFEQMKEGLEEYKEQRAH